MKDFYGLGFAVIAIKSRRTPKRKRHMRECVEYYLESTLILPQEINH